MKMKGLWVCLLFLSFQWLSAQEQEVNSIFWKITGKDVTKPVYLFGTHHLHDYKFIEENKEIDQILRSVEQVLGEIVIDSSDLSSVMVKFAFSMMMKNNTMQNLLSKEEYELVDEALKEHIGMGLTLFNNIKPIFIQQLIMVSKYMKSHETDESLKPEEGTRLPSMENPIGNSMDGYFQTKGKEYEKTVKGLETVDDQLKALYDGYSLERQVEMLLETVYDKGGTASQEVIELTNLYNQQNLNGLLQLMEKSTNEEEIKNLIIDRNKKWIPQIDHLLQDNISAFIAVGAGHLPGKYGVLTLLQKKGYILTPISIEIK